MEEWGPNFDMRKYENKQKLITFARTMILGSAFIGLLVWAILKVARMY